jgi:hypothetical protein
MREISTYIKNQNQSAKGEAVVFLNEKSRRILLSLVFLVVLFGSLTRGYRKVYSHTEKTSSTMEVVAKRKRTQPEKKGIPGFPILSIALGLILVLLLYQKYDPRTSLDSLNVH